VKVKVTMSQSALNSEDLKVVKKHRGVVKGQLTVSLDKLEKILRAKVEGEFDHSVISKAEVKQVGAKLSTNFELFIKLHEKCCILRESGPTDEEELIIATQDDQYTQAITTKYFPMMDLLEKYNKSLNEFETKESEQRCAQKSKENEENKKGVRLKAVMESIPDLQSRFSEALDNYLNSKREASSVTKCLEGVEPDNLFDDSTIQIQPAADVKQTLAKSFEALLVSSAQLKSALKLRGDSDQEIEGKFKFKRSQEQTEIGKLNIELSKILEAKRINSE